MTAGLKWPPEMKPSAETKTAITRPCASATSVSDRANASRRAADEDQRERADELGRSAAQVVAFQHEQETRAASDRHRRASQSGDSPQDMALRA